MVFLAVLLTALAAVCSGQLFLSDGMQAAPQQQQGPPEPPPQMMVPESHQQPNQNPQMPSIQQEQQPPQFPPQYVQQYQQQMPIQQGPNMSAQAMSYPVYYPAPVYQPHQYYPPGVFVPPPQQQQQQPQISGNVSYQMYPSYPGQNQPIPMSYAYSYPGQSFIPPPFTTVMVGTPNQVQQQYHAPPQPQQLPVGPGFRQQNATKPHYTILTLLQDGFVDMNSSNCTRPYHGLIPDLLDAMSKYGDFTYSLALQPDALYGYRNNEGRWVGLIGSLVERRADIGAATLRVTRERDDAVDFALPFYQYNVGLLVNRDYYSTWNVTGVTYLVNPGGSNFQEFNKTANHTQSRYIWEAVNQNTTASYFVGSNREAIARVIGGPFAFITDSPSINRAVNASNGLLERTKDVFSTGYYAFAVPAGSPLREKLSWCLLALMETGEYQRLLNKHSL